VIRIPIQNQLQEPVQVGIFEFIATQEFHELSKFLRIQLLLVVERAKVIHDLILKTWHFEALSEFPEISKFYHCQEFAIAILEGSVIDPFKKMFEGAWMDIREPKVLNVLTVVDSSEKA